MKTLSYLEALILEQIASSNAQLYTDRVPSTLFLNNKHTEEDEVIPTINKFVKLGLVTLSDYFNRRQFEINENGRVELSKFFLSVRQ
jgi:hypothetical protein